MHNQSSTERLVQRNARTGIRRNWRFFICGLILQSRFLFFFYFFLPDRLCLNLFHNLADEFGQRLAAFVTGESGTNGNGIFFLFLGTQNQHVRNLFHLCLTDLIADTFRAVIHVNIDAVTTEFTEYLFRIVIVLVGNRQDANLFRTEPCREVARIFFNELC